MRIGIIGAGGVGGYFGARLAAANHDVVFIARGAHLEAMQTKGLAVKSIKGDLTIHPVTASDQLAAVADCKLIILGVKAWQVKDIAKELKPILNKQALILPLQNGVLAVDELKAHFHEKQVLGGLCMIFSKIEQPGIIHHMGFEPSITFGEIGQAPRPQTVALKTIFENAGIACTLSLDIEVDLWKKFFLICLSGFGAILDSGYGLIRETPETRALLKATLTEIYQVALAKNIHLDPNIVEQSLAIVDAYPAEARSSLARDVLEGKASEIDYQNGTVVRLGQQLDIKTPVNQFIYSGVKFLAVKSSITKNAH